MSVEGSIRLARVFCPARDRNVPVLLRIPSPSSSDSAPSSGAGSRDAVPEPVSCLDYGARCTGWLCPHFALPTLPEGSLLEEAIDAERLHVGRGSGERRSILDRAVREGHARAEHSLSPLSQ